MFDPINIQRLAQIEMKERLEQAEKARYWNQAAVSNRSVFAPIVVAITHYALIAKAAAARRAAHNTPQYKRTTAEIPSI